MDYPSTTTGERITGFKREPFPSASTASSSTAPLDENIICAICYENTIGDIIVLSCGHIYHEVCLIQWLSKKPICPMCLRVIPNEIMIQLRQPIARPWVPPSRWALPPGWVPPLGRVLPSYGWEPPSDMTLDDFLWMISNDSGRAKRQRVKYKLEWGESGYARRYPRDSSSDSEGGGFRKYINNRSRKLKNHKKSKSHKKIKIGKRTKRRRY